MQNNKYSREDLREIIKVFREIYNVEDDPHTHDYQILTHSQSDYEVVRQAITKYTIWSKGDLMWDYILDTLFVVKYESLPLWLNKGELVARLAGWRIKYGS